MNPEDTKRLVDELRYMGLFEDSGNGIYRLCNAAAEAISSLAEERERLTRERDECRQCSARYVDMTDALISCAAEEPFTCGTCRACYIQRAETAEAALAKDNAERWHEHDQNVTLSNEVELTRKQIENWRGYLLDLHADRGADRIQLSALCDMAIRALSHPGTQTETADRSSDRTLTPCSSEAVQSTDAVAPDQMAALHTPGPWAIDPDDRPDMEWNNHIVRANPNG